MNTISSSLLQLSFFFCVLQQDNVFGKIFEGFIFNKLIYKVNCFVISLAIFCGGLFFFYQMCRFMSFFCPQITVSSAVMPFHLWRVFFCLSLAFFRDGNVSYLLGIPIFSLLVLPHLLYYNFQISLCCRGFPIFF